MINKKILGLVPARGGSKGIPNKNIIEVNGLPLISYTIKSALDSQYIDDVIVSTDSVQIANISKEYGAHIPFMRPAYLATDEAKTIDVVLHALATLKTTYDYVVLLQPTQPLRTAKDIDAAIEKLIFSTQDSLVSVSKVKEHPILMRTLDDRGVVTSLLGENSTVRRQDLKDVYIVDGSIYINKVATLTSNTSLNDNTLAYIMESPVVDIDDYEDLETFKKIMKACESK